MKKCPSCGEMLNDNAKFCQFCGINLNQWEQDHNVLHCPKCGAEVAPGAKFCEDCGAKIETPTDSTDITFDNPFSFDSNFESTPKEKKNDSFDFEAPQGDVAGFDSLADKFATSSFESNEMKCFKFEKSPRGTYIITALADKYVTEIIVPKGVEVINDNAFADNKKLLKVELPEGLKTIGKCAFKNCINLKSLNIPSTVVAIDDEAFTNCAKLDVNLTKNVSILGKDVLKGTKTEFLKLEAERLEREIIEKERLAEEKRKAEEAARKKAEEERKRKEAEEAKRKAEKEARRKAEEERKRKEAEEAERIRQENLAAEKKAKEEKERQERLKREKEEAKRKAEEEKTRKEKELNDAIDACYEKAANGNPASMVELGDYYFNGKGVTQSYTEAVYWYENAANKGNKTAMERLGDCYLNGYGVKKSATTAEQWYLKSMK